MWPYSKPLLTGISVKSNFKTAVDFKRLKIIYHGDIYYFRYDYKHLPFLDKPYKLEMNFTENKYQAF